MLVLGVDPGKIDTGWVLVPKAGEALEGGVVHSRSMTRVFEHIVAQVADYIEFIEGVGIECGNNQPATTHTVELFTNWGEVHDIPVQSFLPLLPLDLRRTKDTTLRNFHDWFAPNQPALRHLYDVLSVARQMQEEQAFALAETA